MELLFLIIILLLLTVTGILSVRLGCYKRQMNHMIDELHVAEQSENHILLTSAVPIGRTEEVISAFNRITERSRQNLEQLIRENHSYRESITSISHDIRTPLTSAKGYLQMICNENVSDDKKRTYTETVLRRLDDLSGMLDQLFLYARMEAGELSLSMEPINAGNLFSETISLFYEDFRKKGCEPKIRIPSKPCRIQADRQAFIRIIENLIKNALLHGTGDYELSLQQTGQTAVIRVTNRTESIQAKDVDYIFDRFYTTDLSRGRKMTGLGLAIVKELTGQMGGEARAWLEGDLFTIEVIFYGPGHIS